LIYKDIKDGLVVKFQYDHLLLGSFPLVTFFIEELDMQPLTAFFSLLTMSTLYQEPYTPNAKVSNTNTIPCSPKETADKEPK
jgi:hypothetical protein